MSFGFNKQFKRDDTVAKLKNLQDLKDTQQKTRQLENDKKKMEERIQELKIAMEIEREERAKRSPGGSFWTAGAEGPVINHVQTVLSQKEAPDISKVKKIVVLKDEPCPPSSVKSAAARPSALPGTMAHIASRSAIPHPRVTAAASNNQTATSSCGQCETQLATMHCRECGEHFCRGCFASFHVRGALRGHHPVPISSAPPPPKPEIPLQPKIAFESLPPSGASSRLGSERNPKKVKFTSDSPSGSERATFMVQLETRETRVTRFKNEDDTASQAASSFEGQGTDRSFADEWTAAVSAVSSQLGAKKTKTANSGSDAFSPGPRVHSSNSNKPSVSTCGTSTDVGNINQSLSDPVTEIQFTSSGISYKDRLLINKHRRYELPPPTVLVPKPPPVPGSANRRLRQSREGLGSSTRFSLDASTEQLADHLDFDTIEKELLKIGSNGVLIVNGRPGSAVSFGSARWENALDMEVDDDEWMMQAFSKPSENALRNSKLFDDGSVVEEVLQISDFSDIIESARTPTDKTPTPIVATKSEENDGNKNKSNTDTASQDVNKEPVEAPVKARPNSARASSAKKKATPDQLKRIPTKGKEQIAAEFGAHRLSTQPTEELKSVASTLANKAETPRPVSKAATIVEPSPGHVSNFLLMGVEKQNPEDERRSVTPRLAKPSTPAAKQPGNSLAYSVYKTSPATWKPMNSITVGEGDDLDISRSLSSTTPVNDKPVNKSPSPRVQSPIIMKLRFPAGQRSASRETEDNEVVKEQNDSRPGTATKRSQLTVSMSADETPRSSVDMGPSSFLGRVALNRQLKSEGGSRVPFASAVVPSPRPSSASQRHGYAQPRTPLQQSIDAWRASKQEQANESAQRLSEQVRASRDEDNDPTSSEDENDAGFCGRLATNNGLSSARPVGGSKSQMQYNSGQPPASITPRPHSAQLAAQARASTQVELEEELEAEVKTQWEEADAETLRSLTEELKVAQSEDSSLTLNTSAEQIQIPRIIATVEDTEDDVGGVNGSSFIESGREVNADNSFLNDDDFDDKMALAELASELQMSSSQPTMPVHPQLATLTTGHSHTGSANLNLNLRVSAARESQLTSLTSVTSCWASSPSNSSSLVDGATGGLPAVAEDVSNSVRLSNNSSNNEESSRNSSRKQGTGLVFNALRNSKGNFSLRQSALMDDFDDVEKQLDENGQDEEEEDEEEY